MSITGDLNNFLKHRIPNHIYDTLKIRMDINITLDP